MSFLRCGYAPFWTSYFRLSYDRALFSAKFLTLRKFLEQYNGQQISKKSLETQFSKVIKLKKNARLCTYNNFMRKNLIPFKIVVKRVYLNKKTRARRWFIEPFLGRMIILMGRIICKK